MTRQRTNKLACPLAYIYNRLKRRLFVVGIDYCFSAPCQNGGKCFNTGGTYGCLCPAKYNGTNCEGRE